jgi:hypothetical protein
MQTWLKGSRVMPLWRSVGGLMATPEILLIDELSLGSAPGHGAVCRLIARGS